MIAMQPIDVAVKPKQKATNQQTMPKTAAVPKMTILGTISEAPDSEDDEISSVGAISIEDPRIVEGRPNPVTVRRVKLGNPRSPSSRRRSPRRPENPTVAEVSQPLRVPESKILSHV